MGAASVCPRLYPLAVILEAGISVAQQMKNIYIFFLIIWELRIRVTQKTLRQITEVAHGLESLGFVGSVSVYMCLFGAV